MNNSKYKNLKRKKFDERNPIVNQKPFNSTVFSVTTSPT